jgi:hypothetical protein
VVRKIQTRNAGVFIEDLKRHDLFPPELGHRGPYKLGM